MQASPTTMQAPASSSGPPAWAAPLVVLVLVGGLIALGSRKREAVENPLVDIAILTVGVFAFAAVFRFFAVKLGSPGLAVFFGGEASNNEGTMAA